MSILGQEVSVSGVSRLFFSESSKGKKNLSELFDFYTNSYLLPVLSTVPSHQEFLCTFFFNKDTNRLRDDPSPESCLLHSYSLLITYSEVLLVMEETNILEEHHFNHIKSAGKGHLPELMFTRDLGI